MIDLDGRVIAIAGAGGGLGPVVARRLADAGASPRPRRPHPGERRLARPGPRSPRGPPRPPSGRPPRRVRRQRLGRRRREALRPRRRPPPPRRRLPRRRPDPDFDLADYDFLHGLLVRTLQLTSRAFHRALTQSDHGRFVLVSAAAAQNPTDTNAAYASAKAAAEAWTLALADSFAGTPGDRQHHRRQRDRDPPDARAGPRRRPPHLHPSRAPRRRNRLPLLGLRRPHERPAASGSIPERNASPHRRYSEHRARIAQSVEHFHGKEGVAGSSPAPGSGRCAGAEPGSAGFGFHEAGATT